MYPGGCRLLDWGRCDGDRGHVSGRDSRAVALAWRAGLAGVTALAALVRLPQALLADFPLGDGALFCTAIAELRDAHLALPAVTSFNGDAIPFVYPPLALLLGACLDLLGISAPLTTLRVVPAVLATLTVPVMAVLARRLLGSWTGGLAAAVFFALLPRAWRFLIGGGGLTRALGLLLCLLCLAALARAFDERSRGRATGAGVLGGLTVLSHPEAALLLAISAALLWVFSPRRRDAFALIVRAAIVGLVVVTPWAVTVLVRHGLGPQRAAAAALSVFPPFQTLPSLHEPGGALYVIAAIGLCVAVAGGRWLLPAWSMACAAVFTRGETVWLLPPVALLAGLAVGDLLVPGLVGTAGADQRRARLWPGVAVGLLVLGTLAYGLRAADGALAKDGLHSIPVEDREAMAWVAQHTASGQVFAVLSDGLWNDYNVAEWFPTLSGRRNAFLMQGTEWLPGVYVARFVRQADALAAVEEGPGAFTLWLAGQSDLDALFLPSRSAANPALRAAARTLVASGQWQVVFHRGAVVLVRAQPPG